MADVAAGDIVQIKPGAIDVTNGVVAKAGWKYVEGHSLWMTVEKVVENWRTGGIKGLPATVTKVRCVYGGTVVWQVQPQDIISQVIKPSEPVVTDPPVTEPTTPPTDEGKRKLEAIDYDTPDRWGSGSGQTGGSSVAYYAIAKGQQGWKGTGSPGITQKQPTQYLGAARIETDEKTALATAFGTGYNVITAQGTGVGLRDLTTKERKSIGAKMKVDDTALHPAAFSTFISKGNSHNRKLILNDIASEIQNERGFPAKQVNAVDPFDTMSEDVEMRSAVYDYKINIHDTRYSLTGDSLEDQLQKVRASFGIPVHGSNMIARAMKYYLYNRFKSPDLNLAHNRNVTHVFFTRPDLNILKKNGNDLIANNQVMNHTDAAMIWRRYPEIFKLLTDADACGDPDNFNMLLSSQVKTFDIIDENLSTNEAGRSWNEYSMIYGDAYSGRTAGEFSCTFDEVQDFSVINMMKLWITYIDNVARGAWSPSYNLRVRGDGVASSPFLSDSHVFTKTLDYACSAYVFKLGPGGEDVLYWTKYYGVFPINTGAGALTWDADSPIGSTPKLSIKFAYSFKKDMSPISLIEFNHNAKVASGVSQIYEPTFDINQNQSGRPFVGTPFISMKLANPVISEAGVNYQREITKIRLLFKPSISVDPHLKDGLIYRSLYKPDRTSTTGYSDMSNESLVRNSINREIKRKTAAG